ncbi:MAG: hypothetical protein HOP07_08775 [Bacteriovoracaceae bacterium]|nr:hypothetical protein [Bacteriovoracaceae bacterium]
MSKLVIVTLITLFTLIYGCSSNSKNAEAQLIASDILFNLSDKNGQYNIRVATGFVEKTKSYTTKRIMEIPNKSVDQVIEQSVSISSLGVVKKKSVILRPKISQYSVWFEGKKYFSELKINTAKKAIDVKMKSPESQWNGSKQIKFPSTKLLPCFFNQIIECAKVNGFISKASKAQSGVLNMLVVWEGYPYLNETLSDFTTELFSDAQLEYDGKTKQSERRFSLRVAGQAITYVLDEQDNMKKMFWISQGISMVSKSKTSSKSSLESSESEEGEIE